MNFLFFFLSINDLAFNTSILIERLMTSKFSQPYVWSIPKYVEIFQKDFQYAFLDVPSYILDKKN